MSAASESPVLAFLRCRTPAAWVDAAIANIDLVLQDHAALELKAAQQAQKLIRNHAGGRGIAGSEQAAIAAEIVQTMSRLAREELRHFEQVTKLLAARGLAWQPVPASRYAAGLHQLVSRDGPGALIDSLLAGAVIEARSCERFLSLLPALAGREPAVAALYNSLSKSEARHYEAYIGLAQRAALSAAITDIDDRLDRFLDRDRVLVESADDKLRLHSGVPADIDRAGNTPVVSSQP